MDRSSYEKLSIRESAASLKKYGSTSRHISRNEYFRKHYVENTDTLQGIALKYNVTIEQIRRSNKLWASDSLFLREFLLIPSKEPGSEEKAPSNPEPDVVSPSTSSVNNDDDDDNIDNFLNKIDAAIATTKEEVKKTTRNSKFSINSESSSERRQPAVSRMKQAVNNLGDDNFHQPHAIVVQQGKKVRTSLRHHEEQQDELFQL
ncbi:lysM peptidoglycan-binding domain-containing protein red [Leptinotarsa decemlineata]|uniref:lysM peptidoglycan-binding domain-containing protein red n=1 Tax=Leptinotarsa decemlineata TaxID=7539 RepID=UPI000C251F94|nr:lysM and putative peptidoglycan-binding domain-containing protein 2 [Leptinotarsa decemlineata]